MRPTTPKPESLAVEARRAPALATLRRRVTEERSRGTEERGTEEQRNRGTEERITKTVPSGAVVPCSAPPFSKSCSTGTRARGHAYERKVGKFLRRACDAAGWKLWDHQWFEYKNKEEKEEKVCHFQPDFIIERPGQDGILIEVKLTYIDTKEQLNKYLKFLGIFGINCFPVTIVRNLVPGIPEYINNFNEIKPNSVLHLWM